MELPSGIVTSRTWPCTIFRCTNESMAAASKSKACSCSRDFQDFGSFSYGHAWTAGKASVALQGLELTGRASKLGKAPVFTAIGRCSAFVGLQPLMVARSCLTGGRWGARIWRGRGKAGALASMAGEASFGITGSAWGMLPSCSVLSAGPSVGFAFLTGRTLLATISSSLERTSMEAWLSKDIAVTKDLGCTRCFS